MTLILPPSPTANAYCDIPTADDYHDSRGHNKAWTIDTTVDDREAALKWATRLLDGVAWKGTNEDETNALRFPRSGLVNLDGFSLASDEIPVFLESSCAELALHLIQNDITASNGGSGLEKFKAGSLELVYSESAQRDEPTIPASVSALFSPYVEGGGFSIKLVRA